MRAFRLMFAALLISVSTIAAAQDRPPAEVPTTSPEPAAAPQLSAPEWGGADAIWVQLPPTAFLPGDNLDYTTDGSGKGRRWQTAVSAAYFQAPIDLPQGAKITNLGVFYLDDNASLSVYGQLVECQYTGTPCTSYPNPGIGFPDCIINGWVCSGDATAIPSGSGVYANLNVANIVVDNYNRRYYVNIFLPLGANDGSMKIGGAIVGYRLQVSPAPPTATFSDVPTTHPFFRFIEALYDAGITGGCTPGPNPTYCPDAPITRGEMAVFLAAALGLHWAPLIF